MLLLKCFLKNKKLALLLQHSNINTSLSLDDINDKMGFHDALKLHENNLFPNKTKRKSFKMLANSMLGKFSQKGHYPKVVYVKTKEELDTVYEKEDIIDIMPITEDICELQIQNTDTTLKRNSNCIIGAFVTALARLRLHSDLQKLEKHGFKIHYVDTDGIVFSGKKETPIPLEISPCLGDYKHELGSTSLITNFFCLGRKNYSIMYTKDGNPESIVKVSGLSLNSKIACTSLSANKMKDLVHQRHDQMYGEVSVPQFRNFACENEDCITKKILNVRINNDVNVYRIFQNNRTKDTFPFGYVGNK